MIETLNHNLRWKTWLVAKNESIYWLAIFVFVFVFGARRCLFVLKQCSWLWNSGMCFFSIWVLWQFSESFSWLVAQDNLVWQSFPFSLSSLSLSFDLKNLDDDFDFKRCSFCVSSCLSFWHIILAKACDFVVRETRVWRLIYTDLIIANDTGNCSGIFHHLVSIWIVSLFRWIPLKKKSFAAALVLSGRGGLELLFGSKKKHQVDVSPSNGHIEVFFFCCVESCGLLHEIRVKWIL